MLFSAHIYIMKGISFKQNAEIDGLSTFLPIDFVRLDAKER